MYMDRYTVSRTYKTKQLEETINRSKLKFEIKQNEQHLLLRILKTVVYRHYILQWDRIIICKHTNQNTIQVSIKLKNNNSIYRGCR